MYCRPSVGTPLWPAGTKEEASLSNNVFVSDLKSGDSATVEAIIGGRGVRQKLFDLGVLPGTTLTVLQGGKASPYLVEIGGSKIMIGWGMTSKIRVKLDR